MAVQQGQVDVAYRSLTPTDIDDLSKDSKVKVVKGPGGEERFLVFNFNIQPYAPSPMNRMRQGQGCASGRR